MTDNDKKTDVPVKEDQSSARKSATRFDTIKVYLKDASFEAPSTPKIFTQADVKLTHDIQIAVDYQIVDETNDIHEIILKATVTAAHEDNTVYLAEVHQAGVFRIQHPDANTKQIVIEVACPGILLPFAREELNNLTTKGGFGAFLLSPVNFESLYRSKQQQKDSEAPQTH